MKTTNTLKGYKIDFVNNTIIMNYKFAEASKQYGTAEYNLIKEVLKDFPTMKQVVQSGRKVTTANSRKRLTYANMEKHIRCYNNADELLVQFELAKELSQPLASPYKYVCDWFIAQFPNYKNCTTTIHVATGSLKVLDLPELSNYDEKIYA